MKKVTQAEFESATALVTRTAAMQTFDGHAVEYLVGLRLVGVASFTPKGVNYYLS